MAAITQANVDTISGIRAQTTELMNKTVEFDEFMREIFNAVRQDKNINVDRDWDVIVTKYVPDFQTKKAELVALIGALP